MSAVEPQDAMPAVDEGAEMALIGSLLLQPDLCDEVSLLVKSTDFYSQAAECLYRHILALWNDGRKVDERVLIASLKKSSELKLAGGEIAILDAADKCINPAHVGEYAGIIRNLSTVRAVGRLGDEMARDAKDRRADPLEVIARAETKLFDLLERQHGGEASPIGDVLMDAMDELDSRRHGKPVGVGSGFPDLDSLTGGLRRGELAILAARPSMGKSALALNVAEHVAAKDAVLFVSLEMSKLELGERLLCSVAKVDSHAARGGRLHADDHRKIVTASAKLARYLLEVDDTPSRSIIEIASQARRTKRKKGLGLIVIDYLQLVKPDNARDPRQEQVALISRRLKGLARELDVPVLCLAQLNRQSEQQGEKRPKLSHLRESGAIEQDADQVWFVHREDYYRTDEMAKDGRGEIIVAKNRNGKTGAAHLLWRPEWMRFVTAAKDSQSQEFDGLQYHN